MTAVVVPGPAVILGPTVVIPGLDPGTAPHDRVRGGPRIKSGDDDGGNHHPGIAANAVTGGGPRIKPDDKGNRRSGHPPA
jgi:hypothetical protein